MVPAGFTRKLEGDDTLTAYFLGGSVFFMYFFSYWWNVTMFMMPNSAHGGLFGSDLLTTIGLAQMLVGPPPRSPPLPPSFRHASALTHLQSQGRAATR